ncbi:glutaredoxin family protein [Mycolicibacterium llatzerense]|uniref:Glutaredoxin domain-containing protein n=1 Tax=Mycolicibacterium llatzerense TaxID=280871 RepID=A0A0D1LPA9_9MYCO|nr:glutaredoxin family protein [Mycolicibacterium llatzerense]KIU17931.1 hypothetical protein TL10_06460 [Mycolicibacterium llatzerense]
MVVTVYTKPACPACDATKRRLKKLGIEFHEAQILDGEYAEALAELGITQAPVVCASVDGDEQTWGGYRPDRIDALAGAR